MAYQPKSYRKFYEANIRKNAEESEQMTKTYRELLIECGYDNETLRNMTEEDCEVEYGYLCDGSDVM